MIGTIICRNCDTAIEVSERDVSTFESQASFLCPSCKEDLSARMADLLGTNRPSPSEEKTIPDEPVPPPPDEAGFEGLPVGGSLDDAAKSLRQAAASHAPATPMMASAGVGMAQDMGVEDPLTLALRIAHQAQEQAEALAFTTSGNGAHPAEPAVEATSPGVPAFAANGGAMAAVAASSQVGVVPEEPDNEDTVRRGAAPEGSLTEPTLPSSHESDALAPDTSDAGPVIGEETPALTDEQRAALTAAEDEPDTVVDEPAPGRVPESPTSEATPSAARALPEEPREEPTIRKSGPPPSLVPPARLAPRTGTGPSGIGALGFRISSNRAVVRPAANGRPTMTPPGAGVSGSTSIERPSIDRPSIERVSVERVSRSGAAPRAPQTTPVSVPPPPSVVVESTEGPQPALPAWLLGVGIGVVIVSFFAFVVWMFFGGERQKPYDLGTPTPLAEASATPVETVEVAALGTPVAARTPTVAATTATPAATPTPLRTATPPATATLTPTPRAPTPTPSPALAMATPKATATTSTPRPTATPSARQRVESLVRGKPTLAAGRLELYTTATKNLGDADFVYEAFIFLARPPETPREEADTSRRLARQLGIKYLEKHGTDENKRKIVRGWIEAYDKATP